MHTELLVEQACKPWAPLPMDQQWPTAVFDVHCSACPRLHSFHEQNRVKFPDHFNGPVPPFGPESAQLLIVGLAPGLHGANRSGRPFTGDYCGDLLYSSLNKFGFATKAQSVAVGDGLQLRNARVSNAVKCVPPENKPTPAEIKTCNTFIARELVEHPPQAILALGLVAHQAVLKATGHKQSAFKFGHAAQHDLGAVRLFDSYHVSRYNTQTGRLTAPMFEAVLQAIVDYLPDHLPQ
ncbi:uracil-DNA glycosylase [Limnobacter humi]|uniref:Type-5 uracil-DNA glycosylase n=1 Tax=Limnobacter humi TaxID=1778671 RepID=A0ABT1WFA4_9BURK|nr:uracil-DNA glycosylase [Limnobacter humi]MCQ8896201.1 uracil-DNA glycosylase [Limnobacter humi]